MPAADATATRFRVPSRRTQGYQGYLNLKGYRDLEVENRPQGWTGLGDLRDFSRTAGRTALAPKADIG
jgi:hypothetical protein